MRTPWQRESAFLARSPAKGFSDNFIGSVTCVTDGSSVVVEDVDHMFGRTMS